MCVYKSLLFPPFCLWQEDHEVVSWQTCIVCFGCCMALILYALYIFFLHLFGVSTFTCLPDRNGTACGSYKSMGNWTSVCYGIYLYHILMGHTIRLLSFHPACLEGVWWLMSKCHVAFLECSPSSCLFLDCAPSSCHFILETLAPKFYSEMNQMVCQCSSVEINSFPL